jgi:hypothetical protein
MVDLAGSEKISQSYSADGYDQKQTTSINLGLLALERVILSLEKRQHMYSESMVTQNSSVRGIYIPYRDSALTKILKNTFETDSSISIICNISSEVSDII